MSAKALGDFWSFSLERYSRAGVAELCQLLQDGIGVDVNLLLLCIWFGENGISLGTADIHRLDNEGPGRWRADVVSPLRAARRAMKTPPKSLSIDEVEELRSKLKDLEIQTERLQQILLFEAAGALGLLSVSSTNIGDRRRVAYANAFAYINVLTDEAEFSRILRRLVDKTTS